MYVSQIIMLYTLNLYSAACQLYLSKTGREKKDMRSLQATCSLSPQEPSLMLTS